MLKDHVRDNAFQRSACASTALAYRLAPLSADGWTRQQVNFLSL
ncbi:MAG: hypothetical protein U0X87_11570 [Anaerolineales bacterium]